ncbi:stalk domain-containing protein [Cohnella yongneupensis]|uniref:Stalk domain-containing protein n=1 Tax=Cohnella yongneupensis TaxID=425006 RepID=A0ABW0QZW1_9BACL
MFSHRLMKLVLLAFTLLLLQGIITPIANPVMAAAAPAFKTNLYGQAIVYSKDKTVELANGIPFISLDLLASAIGLSYTVPKGQDQTLTLKYLDTTYTATLGSKTVAYAGPNNRKGTATLAAAVYKSKATSRYMFPARMASSIFGLEYSWSAQSKVLGIGHPASPGSSAADAMKIKQLTDQNNALADQVNALQSEVSSLKSDKAKLESELEMQTEADYSKAVDGWITYETTHLVIHITPKADVKFHYLVTDAEKMLDAHESYFGANTLKGDKVDLWIHDNSGFFQVAASGRYLPWMDALTMNVEDAYKLAGDDSVRFLFAHEMAHAYQYHKWDIDKLGSKLSGQFAWLLEGQADYVAKKLSGYTQYGIDTDAPGAQRDLAYYKTEMSRRSSPSGWTPMNWSDIKTFTDLNGYPGFYFGFEAMVYFFDTNYGRDKYLMLYNNLEKGQTAAEAFKNTFGKTQEALMTEYKAYFGIDKY